MKQEKSFDIWVVYDHPSDYPDSFVARLFRDKVATDIIYFTADIDDMHAFMELKNLVHISPMPEDDKVIKEIWL